MAARVLLFALDSDQGGKNYIFDASFIKMSQKAPYMILLLGRF